MMPRFWLATWRLQPAVPSSGRPWEPLTTEGAAVLAVEVLQDQDRYVVLLSTADALEAPTVLQCRIGFANGAAECNLWRSRGFPVVDAAIVADEDKHTLAVHSAFFAQPEAMEYAREVLRLEGVPFEEPSHLPAQLVADYHQFEASPDPLDPATKLARGASRWAMGREAVRRIANAPVTLHVPDTRSPSLLPLKGAVALGPAWSGRCDGHASRPPHRSPPVSAARKDFFGEAAFRFRDMEVVGFRLDLGEDPKVREALRELIAPLNFHRLDDPATPRSYFDVATSVVLVELLRYGQMQPLHPEAPYGESDFQSQHELVVRLQVGMVSEDGEYAQHPAVYVPAIFVDNPWSKALGRDVQGFEKCLADFCIEQDGELHALRPDGCLHADDLRPRPLSDIRRIGLVDRVSHAAPCASPALLELRTPVDAPGLWSTFRRIDAAALSFELPDVMPRWSSSHFDARAWGSRFVWDAVHGSLDSFECIQLAPVDDRPFDKALIAATCRVRELQVSTPSRTAALRFHRAEQAPQGWQRLCDILGAQTGKPAEQSFSHLNWYRLKLSMDLTGRDDWSLKRLGL